MIYFWRSPVSRRTWLPCTNKHRLQYALLAFIVFAVVSATVVMQRKSVVTTMQWHHAADGVPCVECDIMSLAKPLNLPAVTESIINNQVGSAHWAPGIHEM